MVDFGITYHRQCLTTHSDGDTAERERGEGALPCVLGQDDDTAGRSLVSVTHFQLIRLLGALMVWFYKPGISPFCWNASFEIANLIPGRLLAVVHLHDLKSGSCTRFAS